MYPIFIFYRHLLMILFAEENVELPICGYSESFLNLSEQNPSS
jgi:hypothetical protein